MILGEGNFASITMDRFATKRYKNTNSRPYNVTYDAIRESSILHYLNDCGVKCVPLLLHTSTILIGRITQTKSVMELIDGETLLNLIKKGVTVEDRCRIAELYLDRVLEAIRCIHNHGIIHNDLNLNNIMISRPNNRVIIIDFGISIYDSSCELFSVEIDNEDRFCGVKRTYQADYWLLSDAIIDVCLNGCDRGDYDIVLPDRVIGATIIGRYGHGVINCDSVTIDNKVRTLELLTPSLSAKLEPLTQFNSIIRAITPFELTRSSFKIDSSHHEYISLTLRHIAVFLMSSESRLGIAIDIFRRMIMLQGYQPIQMALAIVSILRNRGGMIKLITQNNQDLTEIHNLRMKIIETLRWRILTRDNVQLSDCDDSICTRVINDDNRWQLLEMSDKDLRTYLTV